MDKGGFSSQTYEDWDSKTDYSLDKILEVLLRNR